VRRQIVARRKTGTPIKQIAADFGLNRSTINDILRAEGVPARRATIGPEHREEIVRLYGEGLSIAQVAKRYGVSDDLMFYAFKRLGIQTRPRRGAA
jgi:transposase-like protein